MIHHMPTLPTPLIVDRQQPTPLEIDQLVASYLDLEERVDAAYRVAIRLDEPLEASKERLILIVEEFGQGARGCRVLRGVTAELVVTLAVSNPSIPLLQVQAHMENLEEAS